MKNGLFHIQCEISMGKYQEQLLNLEDKLESGLYCEMTDKVLYDGYIFPHALIAGGTGGGKTYFLIVACQRPDAKYFTDGIRDTFNFRVAGTVQ